MHDAMLMEEKKKSLKDLIRQMYQLMAKGKEDSTSMPQMGMSEESVLDDSDGDESLENKVDSAEGEEMADEVSSGDSDLPADEKMSFLRRGRTLPKAKGSMIMMKIAAKAAGKKKGSKNV